MGLRGPPAPCVGRRRARAWGSGAPHAGGRGQGVGLRETVLLGEARAGCLGRGRSPRQGVKDFGGAELLGIKAPCSVLFPPAQKTPLLSVPLFPSRWDRERRGEGNRQGRATSIHLESSLLGEGEMSHALVPKQEGGLPVVDCVEA